VGLHGCTVLLPCSVVDNASANKVSLDTLANQLSVGSNIPFSVFFGGMLSVYDRFIVAIMTLPGWLFRPLA
jgi:hypothetical protein